MSTLSDADRLAIWLGHHITRQDSEEALRGTPDGEYLVRASVSAPGDYVISISVGGEVQHHQIKHNQGRMLTRSGKSIDSLPDLIAHYSRHTDGLPVLLTTATRFYDPPPPPPKRSSMRRPAPPPAEPAYQNVPRVAPTPSQRGSRRGTATSNPPPPPPGDGPGYQNVDTMEARLRAAGISPVQLPDAPPSHALPSGALAGSHPHPHPHPPPEDTYEVPDDLIAGAVAAPPPASSREGDLDALEVAPGRVQIMGEIGSGQYGQVFEAYLQGGQGGQGQGRIVAVKTCKGGNEEQVKLFLGEARLLLKFDHPNVLSLVGVVTTQSPMQIIVEFMLYGDVRTVLKSLRAVGQAVTEAELMHMVVQVGAGMQYLSSCHFIHRDLAARNVLLSQYCAVKIGDFGLSRQLADTATYYRVQTRGMLPIKWMAPECMSARRFTQAGDVWSFGVLAWEVFSLGKTPWKKLTSREVAEAVGRGERLQPPKSCPADAYRLMMDCWAAAAADRPSFSQLYPRLQRLHAAAGGDRVPPRDIGGLLGGAKPLLPGSGAAASEGGKPGESDGLIPRDQLRFTADLAEGEMQQIVTMELASGLSAGAKHLVAVKLLKPEADAPTREAFAALMESKLLQPLQHQNLSNFVGVCRAEVPHLLVMQCLPHGLLHGYLQHARTGSGFPQAAVTSMCVQAARAVSFLHSHGIVHGDVGTHNCFVGDGPAIKLCDFGLGRLACPERYGETPTGLRLPLRWTAPESLQHSQKTQASDAWALGVCLWELLTYAATPYGSLPDGEVVELMLSASLPALPLPAQHPHGVGEVLQGLMVVPAAERLTAADALARLDAMAASDHGRDTILPPPPATTPVWEQGTGDIIKSGWLTKQGGGTGTFGKTSWKRRWFVMRDNGRMSYHKTLRPDAKPLGVIDLADALQAVPAEAFEPTMSSSHCFTVLMPSRRFLLVSESAVDAQMWVALINACITARLEGQS